MDSSTWSENLYNCHREKAIQELIQGRDFTLQLQSMLRKPVLDNPPSSTSSSSQEELMAKISSSFTETLSILNFQGTDETSQLPTGLPSCHSRKSEDSGESSKTSGFTDRRGSYKRRKTTETCEKFSSNLIDDGHAWRKYGQKLILNSKHPRNYYRCTHKYEQGCKATKQVQRSDEDDDIPMYRTTYHGHHTCKNLQKSPHVMFLDTPTPNTPTKDSSILLSFESRGNLDYNKVDADEESYFPLIKNEQYNEDVLCWDNHHHQSSSYGYLLDVNFNPMLSSGGSDVISSGVYSSCTTSTLSNDMDMVDGNVNFVDDFHF